MPKPIPRMAPLALALGLAAGLLALPAAAQSNRDPNRGAAPSPTIAAITYRSCTIGIGTRPPLPCGGTGVLYTVLPNGRVMLGVPMGDGSTLGFIAESDRQPRPENYVMQLARVRLSGRGGDQVETVTGTCEVAMSTDGLIWQRVVCEATNTRRQRTRLELVGDGRPAQVTGGNRGPAPRSRPDGARPDYGRPDNGPGGAPK